MQAMNRIPYGLFVLTASHEGRDGGCIVNTAGQVTIDPNRITVAVNKSNHTHDMIAASGRLAISVISEQADFELFRRFGFQSGRSVDKFSGFDAWTRTPQGLPVVTQGVNAWVSAQVEQAVDLGTHTLFVARVLDAESVGDAPSATYAYYHAHIKPRPAQKKPEKTVWRCVVCGYEYEGEELPPDFICPLCKHPASDFEKVQA